MAKPKGTQLECRECAFHFYVNPGSAVGAFISDPEGRVLFVKRAHNPSKGKYGVPGGFIDEDETAEEGLVREVKEELNLQITSFEFLTSAVNRYQYRGVIYSVVDLYFNCNVRSFKPIRALEEVAGYRFIKPTEVRFSSLAFPSLKSAFKKYLKCLNLRNPAA